MIKIKRNAMLPSFNSFAMEWRKGRFCGRTKNNAPGTAENYESSVTNRRRQRCCSNSLFDHFNARNEIPVSVFTVTRAFWEMQRRMQML